MFVIFDTKGIFANFKSFQVIKNPNLFFSFSSTFPISFSVLGDPRSNQNPAILAFGIVFFRWHNEVAKRIQEENPDWSDEDIFQRARRWVIASLQVSFLCLLIVRNLYFNLQSTKSKILIY